jgi:putative ABC transport system permease protein
VASDVPASSVRTRESLVERSMAQRRFVLALLGAFASVALLMAAVGVYGVVAYSVADRAHELGIRVALGATRAHVTQLVMAHGMFVSAAGIAAGLVLAVGLGRTLNALLFGVTPLDSLTLAAAASAQLAVAAAAHYGPVRRALRIDPAESLRQQ